MQAPCIFSLLLFVSLLLGINNSKEVLVVGIAAFFPLLPLLLFTSDLCLFNVHVQTYLHSGANASFLLLYSKPV